MKRQPRALVLLLVAVAMATSSVAFAQNQLGPPGGKIYANNKLFKTIGTPALLPNHGKFDTIYALGHGLANVADAAPGDQAFNGGRWEVRMVDFLMIAPTQFTNADDLKAAAMRGEISIGPVVTRFECPLIPAR
jgi:hypothetical protein